MRRPAGPSRHQADQRLRRGRHRAGRRDGRSVAERAVPPAPAADVRGQEAQHARRDGLFGQRRPDRASGSGAVPDAGTAAPEPDPLEPRSVPDVRLLARAPPRGPGAHPAADELPAEPERSRAAGAEGTPQEPVPVLRRRHDDDRRDRRMGRAAWERRRLARGAAARRAGRLAQREQRGESGGADADRRSVRGGQQGIRHHRPALDGPHRSRGDGRSPHAASRARLSASRWARSAGSPRPIPR